MAEKRVVELEVKTTGSEQAEKSAKTLKQQYAEAKRELQEMALAYGENSEQAIKAARRAGELKDVIDDTSEAIKNLQGGGAFTAVSTSLGNLVGGFGAVQGAINLVGVESEEVEKAILKLQSVMAISEGLRSIEDLGRSFGALKKTVTDVYSSMTAGAKLFAVTGIGLAITAIATFISYMGEAEKSTEELKEEQKKYNEELEKTNDLHRQIENKFDSRTSQYKREIELAEAEGKSITHIYNLKKKLLQARLEDEKSIRDTSTAYKQQQEAMEQIVEIEHELKLLEIDYTKTLREESKKRKEIIENYKINEQELWDETLLGAKAIDDADLERQKAKNDAEAEMTETISAFKIGIWEYEAQKQKELDQQALESQKKLNDLKFQATLQGLTLISDLAEVFGKKGEAQAKKAFKIQKAASIASALITTYQSAVSAYQSQFLPIPDPSSPVRGGIAAGIAVAAGLGNVAKISSQSFSGGSGASGGGGASSSTPNQVITPNFNIVGQSGANTLGQSTQPLQAYVVSGEVTSQQALDRNRLKNATFG